MLLYTDEIEKILTIILFIVCLILLCCIIYIQIKNIKKLYFYIKNNCFCNRNNNDNNDNNNNRNIIIVYYSDIFDEIKDYINKDNDICVICLEELESNIIKLKVCNHILHKKCAIECIQNKIYTCPICRVNLIIYDNHISYV